MSWKIVVGFPVFLSFKLTARIVALNIQFLLDAFQENVFFLIEIL